MFCPIFLVEAEAQSGRKGPDHAGCAAVFGWSRSRIFPQVFCSITLPRVFVWIRDNTKTFSLLRDFATKPPLIRHKAAFAPHALVVCTPVKSALAKAA